MESQPTDLAPASNSLSLLTRACMARHPGRSAVTANVRSPTAIGMLSQREAFEGPSTVGRLCLLVLRGESCRDILHVHGLVAGDEQRTKTGLLGTATCSFAGRSRPTRRLEVSTKSR